MFEEMPNWIRGLCYALFAALGGTMGYVMRTVDSNQKVSLMRAAMEGFGAGFVGFLVLLACQATELTEAWTGVIVGVSGWLGANVTIRLLEKLVRRKLGVGEATPENQNDNSPQQ